jgi:REP element-mobilizing transposase RayT
LRIICPGAWHHITSRGIERRPIFKDDRDRRHFLELLEELVERFGVTLHAFVLMGNHYHLLLELGKPNLSRAIQWLNLSYSVWFNRRHRRCGYLFQGRFKSVVVDPVGWGLGMSAYIHLNPARVASLRLSKADRERSRAGAGELPDKKLAGERLVVLRNFRWSSYRAYVGLAAPPKWLECERTLGLGGGKGEEQRRNYRKYVEDQVREGAALEPWAELRDRLFLGTREFVRRAKAAARGQFKKGERGKRWLRDDVSFEEVIAAVETARGKEWSDFKDRHGDRGRDLVLYLARRATDLSAAKLAGVVGLKGHANVSMAVKRYGAALGKDRAELAFARKAAELLHVTL